MSGRLNLSSSRQYSCLVRRLGSVGVGLFDPCSFSMGREETHPAERRSCHVVRSEGVSQAANLSLAATVCGSLSVGSLFVGVVVTSSALSNVGSTLV